MLADVLTSTHRGCIGIYLKRGLYGGLYRVSGLGLHWDNGKENGNYYNIVVI